VIRITFLHESDGKSSRVSFNFSQASGICGLQVLRKMLLFGAETETYSWVGSSLSCESVCGTVPFVTRNVVKPRLWKPRIKLSKGE